MNRYDVSEPPGQLLLTVRPESRLPNLLGLPLLCGVLLVAIGAGAAFVFSYAPAVWPVPVVLILVLLIYLAISVWDSIKARSLAASGEVYRFDRTHNAVTHNGVLLVVLDQIEGVRVAVVDPLRFASRALMLVIRDGPEVNIPTSNEAEIEILASMISSYLGLRVSHDF